jgi:hypothetical protein
VSAPIGVSKIVWLVLIGASSSIVSAEDTTRAAPA